MDERALSVGELTQLIKGQVETAWPQVWVEGEVSQPKIAGSGHVYFTLKDDAASLSCVLWRSAVQQTGGAPRHGDRVELKGGIKLYPPRGAYQLDVRQWRPAGLGEWERRLQILRAQLEAEGLFAPERKRPLPFLPRRIALITSPSGAARYDMERSIRNLFPPADLVLLPASVQGSRAVAELVAAIRQAGRLPGVDVVVVGRGGGSLEDLWAFNEEAVVRSLADCPIPTVSAVGHEVDVCLTDLVADVRALTPTAVGSLVVPDWNELQDRLAETGLRLFRALRSPLERVRWSLDRICQARAWERPLDLLREGAQRIDDASEGMHEVLLEKLRQTRSRLDLLESRFETLSPLGVLGRGYAVALTRAGDLARVETVQHGDALQIRLQDGILEVNVEKVYKTS